MPLYEVYCIARPKTANETLSNLMRHVSRLVKQRGGVVRGVQNIGLRPLAYRVRAHATYHDVGRYWRFDMIASPKSVVEVAKRLRVDESIIRVLPLKSDMRLITHKQERPRYKTPGVVGEAHYDVLRRTTNIDYYIARTLLETGELSPEEVKELGTHTPAIEPVARLAEMHKYKENIHYPVTEYNLPIAYPQNYINPHVEEFLSTVFSPMQTEIQRWADQADGPLNFDTPQGRIRVNRVVARSNYLPAISAMPLTSPDVVDVVSLESMLPKGIKHLAREYWGATDPEHKAALREVIDEALKNNEIIAESHVDGRMLHLGSARRELLQIKQVAKDIADRNVVRGTDGRIPDLGRVVERVTKVAPVDPHVLSVEKEQAEMKEQLLTRMQKAMQAKAKSTEAEDLKVLGDKDYIKERIRNLIKKDSRAQKEKVIKFMESEGVSGDTLTKMKKSESIAEIVGEAGIEAMDKYAAWSRSMLTEAERGADFKEASESALKREKITREVKTSMQLMGMQAKSAGLTRATERAAAFSKELNEKTSDPSQNAKP